MMKMIPPRGAVMAIFTLCFLFVNLIHADTLKTTIRTRTIINKATGGTITVQYDPQGTPFITASTEQDLFFAQGQIVAENRLWQMEVFRRYALGRTAEIFGPATTSIDIQSRRMQWLQVCQQNVQNCPPKYTQIIQYYMDGVNTFLDAANQDPTLLPPEFAFYGAPAPAPYEVIDAFLIVKAFSTGLSGDARSEPRNEDMLKLLGYARYHQYFSRDPQMPYIVPPYSHSNYSKAASDLPFHSSTSQFMDTVFDLTSEQKNHLLQKTSEFIFAGKNQTREKHLENDLGEFLKAFNPPEFTRASNSWVIHGDHTESGLPLFSNDPHLSYTAPIVWFIVGLHVDDPSSKWQHIIGATLVLAPGIGIGRNEHIAWGYTMVQSDNQDLYVMSNLPGNLQYNYNNTVMTYEISTEVIQVKGHPSTNITCIRSVYGPVIVNNDGVYYSLRWTAQYPTEPSIIALIDQNTATTYEEYLTAVSNWWSLSFNAVFGDAIGNIGYHATGAIPHRRPGDTGRLPKIGDGSRDWLGILPFNQLPNFVNPSQGYIVTANNPLNRVWEEAVPIQGTFAIGFRAQRIIDMIQDQLNAGGKINVNYSASIQASVVTLEFSYLYPTIQRLALTKSSDLSWQTKLLSWDGNELVDSQEATIYEEFVFCLRNVTFHEVGFAWEDPYFTARVFNNASVSGAGDDVACTYWNMTCLEFASQCFSSTVAKYPLHVSKWGSFPHYASFVHLLPLPVEDNLFAAVGGSGYTPNAAHCNGARGPVVAGPSLRFIADLSGSVPNQMVLPGGESGNPTSVHYSDQLSTWQKVQTYDVDWSLFAASSSNQ